jgi:zinc/manganese transport system substrate-binding protein
MRRIWIAFAALLIGSLVLGTACGEEQSAPAVINEGETLKVVATTAILGALAQEVGGDSIELNVLASAGSDPHDYELTAADRKTINDANVVIRLGVGDIDTFIDKAITSKGNSAKTIEVVDGITLREATEEEGHESEDDHGDEEDPHVWHNPQNVKQMAENIAAAFARADPANAETYRQNAAAYARVVDDTDAQVRRLIDSIPPANRKMVMNHDSLGYFIDYYGLEYVGAVIPGLSSQSEPSARAIADLSDLIRAEGVKAIFAEGSLDPRVARQIAADTGVTIVDDIYGDTLGEPGSGAETVHGMLLYNARKIAEALR